MVKKMINFLTRWHTEDKIFITIAIFIGLLIVSICLFDLVKFTVKRIKRRVHLKRINKKKK